MFLDAIAVICLIWYLIVILVCGIGYVQLFRHYTTRFEGGSSLEPLLKEYDAPRVTIIRPVKGLDSNLYDCLASTFYQTYDAAKLTIFFCISHREDPAFPVLQQLLHDFPKFDARITVEEDDARTSHLATLGPNPKIRNMSTAYRSATSDIVWIIDCNVWVSRKACQNMMNTLHGDSRPYKFVHLLPLVVDVSHWADSDRNQGYPNGSLLPQSKSEDKVGGCCLEEMFMSSAHAKFYTAINTVSIAPCIVGKSTMFRKSHLEELTRRDGRQHYGIDYFSSNICEDHLIGDLLWKQPLQEERRKGAYGKHALVLGDLAIQPMGAMSVQEYVARRVRWLRVRKFTVALATLVEPGTESFLCSLYGAFAVTRLTTLRAMFPDIPTWLMFPALWLTSVSIWAFVDRILYINLHSNRRTESEPQTPTFARQISNQRLKSFRSWLPAWLLREALAFPVWAWAVFGGTEVEWRNQRFWVGLDMKVHHIPDGENASLQNGLQKFGKDGQKLT